MMNFLSNCLQNDELNRYSWINAAKDPLFEKELETSLEIYF